MLKKFGDKVGRFYYICCQLHEIQRKYRNSNRKWQMCYDCKRKIVMKIDINLGIAVVDIYHGLLHPRPDLCSEMPIELYKEIEANLHLITVKLTNHLQCQGFNISTYSPKRIYFWKSIASRSLFQYHNNHVESACMLLEEYYDQGFHWYLDIPNSEHIANTFTTPLLNEINNFNINISEIYIDTTYKTARGRYKLYNIIANVERTKFPIAYLVLDITKATDSSTSISKRSKILKNLFEAIKAYGINLSFVFIDKDFMEINTVIVVWGSSVV